jgi:hypothetical protein
MALENLRRRLDWGGNVAGEPAMRDNVAGLFMIEDRHG